MKRAHLLAAAAFAVTTSFAAAELAGQGATAPPMTPVLSGGSFQQPARGEVIIEYGAPNTRREKDQVVTRVTVKNVGTAPIARLTFTETWYAKDNSVVSANKGMINGLLQPGEIKEMTISTPYDAKMNAPRQAFSHANGTVKPTRVPKLDVPKETATAASTKK
jgi:hypothetical protein